MSSQLALPLCRMWIPNSNAFIPRASGNPLVVRGKWNRTKPCLLIWYLVSLRKRKAHKLRTSCPSNFRINWNLSPGVPPSRLISMSDRELTSQYFRIPSAPPLTNPFPSGMNATQSPIPVCPSHVSKRWPVRVSHILSKPSKSTDAICRPFGLNVIPKMLTASSSKVLEEPSRRDQIRIQRPSPPTMKRPSGEKQRDSRVEWCVNAARTRFRAISHN